MRLGSDVMPQCSSVFNTVTQERDKTVVRSAVKIATPGKGSVLIDGKNNSSRLGTVMTGQDVGRFDYTFRMPRFC